MASAQSDFRAKINLLLRTAKASGYAYVVTSKRRSSKKQAQLKAAGGQLPVAEPGRSQHQFGLAWDIVFDRDGNSIFGSMWAQAGYGWDASDPVHFAYFTAAEWAQILNQVEIAPSNLLPVASGLANILPPVSTQPPHPIVLGRGFGTVGISAGVAGRPGVTTVAAVDQFGRPVASHSAIVNTSPLGAADAPSLGTVRTLTPGVTAASAASISPGRGGGGPGGLLSTVATLPRTSSIVNRRGTFIPFP